MQHFLLRGNVFIAIVEHKIVISDNNIMAIFKNMLKTKLWTCQREKYTGANLNYQYKITNLILEGFLTFHICDFLHAWVFAFLMLLAGE